jgi:23S rRNA pseudouridine2605 synthase
MAEDRVQKILAQAGFGSRRANEELITAGRVRVNGVAAILGTKADASKDKIEVDGHVIPAPEKIMYIALNKPRGVLSDVDPHDPRQTVRDLVPVPGHLFPVGRLDMDSEGLILLTNDGELANRLTHPRYEHEKEYRVLVASHPDMAQLEAWRHGVVMEDGTRTAPAKVDAQSEFGKGSWMRIVMHEGRKREIREVGSRIGLPVVRILRVRIGTLLLGSLKPREWRYLTPQEVEDLKLGKVTETFTKLRNGKPNLDRKTGQAGRRPRTGKPESGLSKLPTHAVKKNDFSHRPEKKPRPVTGRGDKQGFKGKRRPD